jgi:N6-adenosine-specific RNA methylase IME4
MKKYSVIVADCPWSFSDKLTMSKTKRGSDSNYNTMSLDDIASLSVEKIAADDAVLALWVPSSLIHCGLVVMEDWGFTQKGIFTWIKTTKDNKNLSFGLGHTFRNCSENALVGTRGKPKCLNHAIRNVALDPATAHSVKPDTLQLNLMQMFDGPYLELFGRRNLDEWTVVGNEAPDTMGVDIKDWLREQIGE